MRKGYKVVLFIGIGMVVAALIILLVVFLTTGFQPRTMFAKETDIKEEKVQKEIVEKIHSLRVRSEEDDIVLKKSENEKCLVEFTERGKVDYELAVEDGKLELVQKEESWKNPMNFMQNLLSKIPDNIFKHPYRIVISLPENEYETLELENVSGDIAAEDVFFFDTAALSTVSGDIYTKNLKTEGPLTVAATSGDINLESSEAKGPLSISSVSGNILADHVDADSVQATLSSISGEISLKNSIFKILSAKTTSGDVNLELIEAGKLDITTVSGDVEGRVSKEMDFNCKTVSGDISVPEGGTNSWIIETTSGDIHITK